MIYLDSPFKSLMITLAGAVSANQMDISSHFFDVTPQATTTLRRGGVQSAASNNTSDVTIVANPALQGIVRNIHTLFINNKDTATATVTVKIDDNGAQKVLVKQSIAAGESLTYEDNSGWTILSPITPPFIDTTPIVRGSVDSTKLLRIEVDGLTSGVTRTWTAADADIMPCGHASGLTNTRVPYATGATGGVLTDSANMVFDGTKLTVNTLGAFTLAGTIAGGGNQLNNIIIGTSTPLAGAFTTISATGDVTLSSATAAIVVNAASTSQKYLRYGNTGNAGFYFGIESSVGGTFFSGSSAYASVLYSQGTLPIEVMVNAAKIASFATTGLSITGTLGVTGAGTFSNTLSVSGGNFDVTKSDSGNALTVQLFNSSNTASSAARLYVVTAGSSADDPFARFSINGVTEWSVGSDNSDSDKFKISKNATLGTNDYLTIDTSGVVSASTAAVGTNTTQLATTAFVSAFPQQITASLGSDTTLNNAANYFDGPSVAQGTSGTWFATGTVTVQAGSAASNFSAKLWDGTTVIASCVVSQGTVSGRAIIALSGYLASPAGNIRISVKDVSTTDSKILYNNSGNSKDSTITAFKVAN